MKMASNLRKAPEGIEPMAKLFLEKKRFLLLCHVNPDGDTLGSALALAEALTAMGKEVTLFSQDGLPKRYQFLHFSDNVSTEIGSSQDYDLAVLIDCHTLDRAGRDAEMASAIPGLAVIDHHRSEGEVPGQAVVIDPDASAAGELVYYLLIAMRTPISAQAASNLYTAMTTDTGSFSYSNATAECLAVASELVLLGADPWEVYQGLNHFIPPERLKLMALALDAMKYHHRGMLGIISVTRKMMASTGTTPEDTKEFVDFPRSVRGVELAVFVRETKDGACHVSLRSQGRADAASLAEVFGGGGHFNAAGFSTPGTAAEVIEQIRTKAGNFLPSQKEFRK
jgi:phosphoesterase RecJ-like protein